MTMGTRREEIGLILKLIAGGFGGLSVLMTLIAWLGGILILPQVVCDAVSDLCTPTPTVTVTLAPPTSTPTITPTPTVLPTPTPSPTPTPGFGGLLGGCTHADFDFAVAQVSPIERYVTQRTAGPVRGLTTQCVITNTGICRLVGGRVVDLNDPSATQTVAELPPIMSQGETLDLTYEWPELSQGRQTITLTLQFMNVEGNIISLPGREFVLEVDLSISLDRDGDGVLDRADACPDEAGVEELAGCPDSDGDGITDQEDCCPETAGMLNGCPDLDGDGFPERNDRGCPGLPPVDECPGECGNDPDELGCPLCWFVYDICTRCVSERNGECLEYEEYYCNRREVCEPCP